VLSARWALTWKHLAVCLLFGGLFVYLNHLPLADWSIWLHLHRGEQALGRLAPLPAGHAEPAGVGAEIVDTCWLSEAAYALAHRFGGPQYVSHLFALVALAYLATLGRVFYLQTNRVGMMAAGVAAAAVLGARHPIAAGPAVFGALCLALLLWIVSRLEKGSCGAGAPAPREAQAPWQGNGALWLALAVLFVVWANLHGSFLLGIGVLGCYALGRMVEVGWRARRAAEVVSDRSTQQWVILTACAAAASLVNPYGFELLAENVRVVGSANLRETGPWLPLTFPALPASLFLLCFVLLSVVLRHSRRPVRPVEVLLLILFGAMVLPTRRALGWFGPVFVFVALPHLGDVAGRVWPVRQSRLSSREPGPLKPRHFAVTLLCGLVVWCSFALAPISQDVLGGDARTRNGVLGPRLPDELTERLEPEELVFTSVEWADWLVWNGPPGVRVYMNSDVHRVARPVWHDYKRIHFAGRGWEAAADRYGIGTMVLSKRQQAGLSGAIQRSARWEVAWENETALLARRVRPLADQKGGPRRISDRGEGEQAPRS
jgi:hypothetical protein